MLAVEGSVYECRHLADSSPQTPLGELFDLFLRGRSFLCTMDSMSTVDRNDPKACLALLGTLLDYRDKLTSWYITRKALIGGDPLLCGENDCKTFNKVLLEESPFGGFYQFSSLDNARLHVIYWTAMSFAHTLVYRAQMIVVSLNRTTFLDQHHPSKPSNHEAFVMAGHYADEVCRSVPYCMQPMNRIWGTHVVFGTIGNALKVYLHLRSQEKFIWCQRVLEVARGLGIEMALYFSGVAKKKWDLFWNAGETSQLRTSSACGESEYCSCCIAGPGNDCERVSTSQLVHQATGRVVAWT